MNDYIKLKIKEFDNTLVDWNSPRFLADNKTVDDVRSFLTQALQQCREDTLSEVEEKIKKKKIALDYIQVGEITFSVNNLLDDIISSLSPLLENEIIGIPTPHVKE